jgi:hypothetical protein
MSTKCSTQGVLFPGVAGRDAVVHFNAGDVTSNGGVLMLERADRRIGLMSRFAACFRDHRDPDRVEHTARHLVSQRVFGLCLGYEDVSDHDGLGLQGADGATVGEEEVVGEAVAGGHRELADGHAAGGVEVHRAAVLDEPAPVDDDVVDPSSGLPLRRHLPRSLPTAQRSR